MDRAISRWVAALMEGFSQLQRPNIEERFVESVWSEIPIFSTFLTVGQLLTHASCIVGV